VTEHVRFGEALPTWKSTMHMYPIDGATTRVGADETAWTERDGGWVQVMVGVDPEAENRELLRDWCVSYWEALHPYSAGGSYVNMMMEEGDDRVRTTYGANYERLAQVKAEYDPGNLFHVNQNIKPA
jgi:FAD/FMN-containing dehydrogenase